MVLATALGLDSSLLHLVQTLLHQGGSNGPTPWFPHRWYHRRWRHVVSWTIDLLTPVQRSYVQLNGCLGVEIQRDDSCFAERMTLDDALKLLSYLTEDLVNINVRVVLLVANALREPLAAHWTVQMLNKMETVVSSWSWSITETFLTMLTVFSQVSMHSIWNLCLQFISRTSWSALKSSKQMEHFSSFSITGK